MTRQLAENPRLTAPRPPGPWVTAERCACGATYRRHRAGCSFGAVRRDLAAQGFAFLSRGPVLWGMRTAKLTDWYCTHADCDPSLARRHGGGSGPAVCAVSCDVPSAPWDIDPEDLW